MRNEDPWLTERMRADKTIRNGEERIRVAVLDAMRLFLDTARALVLGEELPPRAAELLLPAVRAAGEETPPDLDAAQTAFQVWADALTAGIVPAVSESFGEGFAAIARAADITSTPYVDAHIADVFDRLVIWPEGAWEEIRPELQESIAESESIDEARDRVGRVLDIDAPSRKVRAKISHIDRLLADPDTPAADLVGLRADRRRAWNLHDETQKEWHWLARRIARTEVQGAVEGGNIAAARAVSEAGGEKMFKQWLATSDERTRHTHSIADGQIVPVGEKFQVGKARLDHPADPRGRPEETINCRCTLLILDEDEVKAALRGKWGRRGVSPMSARRGPDPIEDVDHAIDLRKRELAGEIVDWPGDTRSTTAAATGEDETVTAPVPPKDEKPKDEDVVEPPVEETEKPEAEKELPTGFRGPIMPVNKRSGDLREMAMAEGVEEVPTRPLPIALSAQDEMWEGHDGSRVVGLITRTWLSNGMVYAEGPLDLGSEAGREYARRLRDMPGSGWVSADLSDIAVEEVPLDKSGNELDPAALQAAWEAYEAAWSAVLDEGGDPADADLPEQPEEPANYLLRLTSWKLMGATGVSSPAFEDARIEPVYGETFLEDGEEVAPDGDAEELVAAAEEAAEEHTGAMVALVPAETDAAVYAVEGGEPVDQLHVTLAFLGEATDWTPEARAALEETIRGMVPGAPIEGATWGTALFNPQGPEPCAVYLVQADGLADLHDAVLDVAANTEGGTLAEQHDGYVPHMTAGYGLDVASLAETGPVTFDRIRIAWAGEAIDIPLGSPDAALTASAAVFASEDFFMPEPEEPVALTITDDGRVYGHLATWGTCHIGFADTCVTPPESGTDYRYFHQGEVLTEAGRLAIGKITLGTGHAGRNANARAAASHYDDTGTVAAVVRCKDGTHGPWMSGRLVPDLPETRVEELRRAGVSGDWRGIGGRLELVAALAVNVPGFPIPRTQALAASGQQVSLIAAGIVAPVRKRTAAAPSPLVFDTSGMSPQEVIRAAVRATFQEMNEEKARAARRDAAAGIVREARVASATRRVNG